MTTPTPPGDEGADVPGDTGAADIVAPTGEEMPVATHDEVSPARSRQPDAAPTPGNGVPYKGTRPTLPHRSSR